MLSSMTILFWGIPRSPVVLPHSSKGATSTRNLFVPSPWALSSRHSVSSSASISRHCASPCLSRRRLWTPVDGAIWGAHRRQIATNPCVPTKDFGTQGHPELRSGSHEVPKWGWRIQCRSSKSYVSAAYWVARHSLVEFLELVNLYKITWYSSTKLGGAWSLRSDAGFIDAHGYWVMLLDTNRYHPAVLQFSGRFCTRSLDALRPWTSPH